jgi:hypothetical protein
MLDKVKVETTSIALTAPAVLFDKFVCEAQKVLDTVWWKGAWDGSERLFTRVPRARL